MKTAFAIAQFNAAADPAQNLAAIAGFAGAAEGRAHMLMLPEYAMTYPARRLPEGQPFPGGQSLDGPFVRGLCELARIHRLWISCGVIESTPDDPRPYNTTVIISSAGTVVAKHRKCQLYDAFSYRESDHFRAGDTLFTPISTPFGTFGLIVCYELRFPELARLQALQGIDFLLVTAAFTCGPRKAEQWRTLLKARAIENGCFVVGCDHTKPHVFLGQSAVYAPDGGALLELHDAPGLSFISCDHARIETARQACPVLEQRRTDLYQISPLS